MERDRYALADTLRQQGMAVRVLEADVAEHGAPYGVVCSAGIIGTSKALSLELTKRRITVNCVVPGLIDTDMVDAEVAELALKMIPAQRMGKPEEVAAAVRFLLPASAGYITRQVISLNGGLA